MKLSKTHRFHILLLSSFFALSCFGCTNQSKDEPSKDPEIVSVQNVSFNKTTLDLYLNESENLVATVTPNDATYKSLIWISLDKNIAIVDDAGKVTALGIGTTKVRAISIMDGSIFAECTVNVTRKDTKIHVDTISVSPKEIAFDLAGTTEADPTVAFAPTDATDKELVWTSSDPNKVAVDSNTGHLVALAETSEAVIITAKSVDNNSATDTLEVSVADTRDPTVHVTSVTLQESITLDLKDGAKGNLTATIAPNDAWNKLVNWTISSSDIVSYTALGDNTVSLQGLKVGSATITATSDDNSTATATCTINVIDSTKYVTGVTIKVNGVAKESVSIEKLANIDLTASVLPTDATYSGVTWSYAPDQTNPSDYVTISSLDQATTTITAKKLTSTPIVIRASSTSQPEFYKDIEVSVVKPEPVYDEPADSLDGVDADDLTPLINAANKIGRNYTTENFNYFNDEAHYYYNIFYKKHLPETVHNIVNDKYEYLYYEDDKYESLDNYNIIKYQNNNDVYQASLGNDGYDELLIKESMDYNGQLLEQDKNIKDLTFDLSDFNEDYINNHTFTRISKNKYECRDREVWEDFFDVIVPDFENEGFYMTFIRITIELDEETGNIDRIRLYCNTTQIGKLIKTHKDSKEKPNWYLLFAECNVKDIGTSNIPCLESLYR